MENSVQKILSELGLEKNDIKIYLTLQENGELSIPEIIKKSSKSRTSVYTALDTLFTHDLIHYRKEGRNAYYSAAHPTSLTGLLEAKKRNLDLLQKETEEIISQLAGVYNLTHGKPGIRFLEGEAGLKEANNLTLKAEGEILTILNTDSVEKYASRLNSDYVKKRINMKIPKRLIVADTDIGRKRHQGKSHALTQTRFISVEQYPFTVGAHMFNNTVIFLTALHDTFISIVIEHPHIAQYQKALFEYIWSTLPDEK